MNFFREKLFPQSESKDLKNRDKEFLSDFFNLCQLYKNLAGWKKKDFVELKSDIEREWKKKKETDRRFQPNPELQTALAEIEQEYNQVFSRLKAIVESCFASSRLQEIFQAQLGQEIHSLAEAEEYIQKTAEPFYLDFKDKNPFGEHINDFPTEHSSEKNLKEYQAVLQEITDSPDWQAIVKKLTVLPGSHYEALEQYQQEEDVETKNKALRRLLALGRPEEVEQEDFPIDLNKLEIDFDERELSGLKDNLTQAKTALEQFQTKWPKVLGKKVVGKVEVEVKKPVKAELSEDIAEQIKEAREILGQDVLGPEEVEEAFSVKLDTKDIPPIPFSRQELEQARELGQMLVLRINRLANGLSLTMKNLNSWLQPIFDREEKGKILYNISLSKDNVSSYKDEDFFKKDTPRSGWHLVSKEPIPYSLNNNYVEQTKILRYYLVRHNLASQAELAECSDQKLEELAELMMEKWDEAAKQLSELLINQNYRRLPVEERYDTLLYFLSNGQRLLENRYDWTKRRGSDGSLVSVGCTVAEGARVGIRRPIHRGAGVGVCLSRGSS